MTNDFDQGRSLTTAEVLREQADSAEQDSRWAPTPTEALAQVEEAACLRDEADRLERQAA